KKEISILQTDIVDSAKRRLGLKELIAERERKAKWPNFIIKQIDRQKDLLAPEFFSIFHKNRKDVDSGNEFYLRRLPAEIIGLFLTLLFLFNIRSYYRKLNETQKTIALLSILSGFVWLYTMRKLATYHDYTTMYYVGFLLMAYITIFSTKLKNISSKNV